MNNKGQSLALFVILIPFLFILIVGLLDLGNLYIERRNLNNTLDMAIDYYKDGKDTEKFINNNIKDLISFKINDSDGVSITISKKVNGILKDNVVEITKKG